jgi:hypothetical protein
LEFLHSITDQLYRFCLCRLPVRVRRVAYGPAAALTFVVLAVVVNDEDSCIASFSDGLAALDNSARTWERRLTRTFFGGAIRKAGKVSRLGSGPLPFVAGQSPVLAKNASSAGECFGGLMTHAG